MSGEGAQQAGESQAPRAAGVSPLSIIALVCGAASILCTVISGIPAIIIAVIVMMRKQSTGKDKAFAITGMALAVVLSAVVLTFAISHMASASKELTQAHALYESGKKDEALAVYRKHVDIIPPGHESKVLSRLIDSAAQSGDMDLAKKYASKASGLNALAPETAVGKAIVADLRWKRHGPPYEEVVAVVKKLYPNAARTEHKPFADGDPIQQYDIVPKRHYVRVRKTPFLLSVVHVGASTEQVKNSSLVIELTRVTGRTPVVETKTNPGTGFSLTIAVWRE